MIRTPRPRIPRGHRSGVGPVHARVAQQPDQRLHVPQPEVEALRPDRVERVRGVADEHGARGGDAGRVRDPEGVTHPPLDVAQLAEPAPEHLGETLREPGTFEIGRGRDRLRNRPHEPAALLPAGQHGEGAALGEALERAPPVRALRGEVARERDVVAAVDADREPGRAPHCGVRAVRPDHEPCGDGDRTVRAGRRDERFPAPHLDRLDGGTDPLEPACAELGVGVEGLVQPSFERPGRGYVAERIHPALPGPDPGEAEAPPPGDMDLRDGGRVPPDLVPQTERAIEPGRAERQGKAARVGATAAPRIDHRDRERPPAERLREGGADEPAADDRDIAPPDHAADPTMPSRSSTDLGREVDRTSTPSRVTSTTSSIRMPIPRQGAATAASAGSM